MTDANTLAPCTGGDSLQQADERNRLTDYIERLVHSFKVDGQNHSSGIMPKDTTKLYKHFEADKAADIHDFTRSAIRLVQRDDAVRAINAFFDRLNESEMLRNVVALYVTAGLNCAEFVAVVEEDPDSYETRYSLLGAASRARHAAMLSGFDLRVNIYDVEDDICPSDEYAELIKDGKLSPNLND